MRPKVCVNVRKPPTRKVAPEIAIFKTPPIVANPSSVVLNILLWTIWVGYTLNQLSISVFL